MAGKLPTKDEISSVLSAYLAKTPGVACEYDKDADTYLLKDANGKEAIIGPGWKCSDDGLFGELAELLMTSREGTEAPRTALSPVGDRKMSAPEKYARKGQINAAQAIQTMQSGKDLAYTVNKKAAPSATMALMAATDAKINLQEVASVLTDELASSTIRATAKNGRSVDATVSIRKADFINLLAWKEVDEQEKHKNSILDDSDPMNIALPNGFPRIKPDAMVTIRVKDELSSRLEKRRAIVHIYITAMQQWIFQQRQCQTKAKRNAVIQMLTSSGNPTEVMDEDELADEERERKMVEEAA